MIQIELNERFWRAQGAWLESYFLWLIQGNMLKNNDCVQDFNFPTCCGANVETVVELQAQSLLDMEAGLSKIP
jgi:hypothetical protein